MSKWETFKRWLRQLAGKDLPSAVVKDPEEVLGIPIVIKDVDKPLLVKKPIVIGIAGKNYKKGDLVPIGFPLKTELEKRAEQERQKWLPPPPKPGRRITRRKHQSGRREIKISRKAFRGPPKTAFEKRQWKKSAKTAEEEK